MKASRNAQLAQPVYEQAGSAQWQRTRLELLKPQEKQRQAKRRREAFSYVLLAMLLFGAALAYMYMEARINVAGHEVNKLQEQIAETERLALRTELEIGSLSSLARIESYANLHLGMVYPDVKSVQYLSPQVTARLNEDLSSLAAAEQPLIVAAEESIAAPQEEGYPLFVAWAQMLGNYFSGTALAIE